MTRRATPALKTPASGSSAMAALQGKLRPMRIRKIRRIRTMLGSGTLRASDSCSVENLGRGFVIGLFHSRIKADDVHSFEVRVLIQEALDFRQGDPGGRVDGVTIRSGADGRKSDRAQIVLFGVLEATPIAAGEQ